MKPVPPIAMSQLYGPPTMSGAIGKGQGAYTGKAATGIKADFQNALMQKVNTWMGTSGTPGRARMEQVMSGLVDPTTGQIDLSKLDPESLSELKKLQGASEGFESSFVKQLLTTMRQSTFAPKESATMDMAKDMMDQKISDSTAQGAHGLGIARTVYATMGEQVIRQAASRAKTISTSATAETSNQNSKN